LTAATIFADSGVLLWMTLVSSSFVIRRFRIHASHSLD
jgi:hypothetical protein